MGKNAWLAVIMLFAVSVVVEVAQLGYVLSDEKEIQQLKANLEACRDLKFSEDHMRCASCDAQHKSTAQAPPSSQPVTAPAPATQSKPKISKAIRPANVLRPDERFVPFRGIDRFY